MIDAETLTAICNEIAEGKSLRAVCRDRGISESLARYYLNKDADAFAQLVRARELGCDAIADECMSIADNSDLEPADRRIRIETRIKLLSKWSQRYGDKLTVDSNKTVTHRYDLGSLETDRLEQLEGILADARRGSGDTGEAEPSSVH